VEKFILDTNIFIEAIRDGTARVELAEWQRAMAPHLWQHAVVISELLVGAKDEATWKRWHERWVLPAERVHRVVVPGYGSWLRASRIISRLAQDGWISIGSLKPSFYNDCLLAATARDHGHVIITHNEADFNLIGRVESGVHTAPPFP
jgi:predicted nucleic acid-binding protein